MLPFSCSRSQKKKQIIEETDKTESRVRRKGDVKKAMRLLITLLLLMRHSCVRSLPIQSQALENIDDQFFWQQAWFDDKPDSPFLSGGDGKKITAKSIFILPSFEKKANPYCPPGYLVDDIGKCIKIVSSHKSPEEILASRLINLIPTSDANSFYDYEYDETETNDDQLSNLPALVPILNENNSEDESKSTATSSESSPLQYFRDSEKNQTSSMEIIITTLSSHDENDTMTYEHEASTVITQDEPATTPPITTVVSDVDIYEQSTDALISESSDTINFDADNAFLFNESLIIANDDKNSSFDADYSELLFTTMEPMEIFVEQNQHTENSTEENSENFQQTSSEVNQLSKLDEEHQEGKSTSLEQHDYSTKSISEMPATSVDLDSTFKYESTSLLTDNDDRQNENKFVYHHLREPTTTTMPALSMSTTAAFANKLLRFPSSTEEQRQRVRFPDDDEIFTARQTPVSTSRPSSSFSWPRESNTQSNSNNGGVPPGKSLITRFWNQQPLIADYNARSNTKNFRNVLPFTRKVLTPPHQYNYRK